MVLRTLTKSGRGIYLLPNLLTTGALFSGFYSIVAAMNQHYDSAAIAIFVAIILDGMDGRIARLTNTQSEFGMQYDSLSDMISFGLAPSLVVYQWVLFNMGKLGWLAAFVYTACASLRLARFNTQATSIDKRYFQGLPSPGAAAVLGGAVWFGSSHGLADTTAISIVCFLLTIIVGLLMVSNIRYHSFKEFDPKNRIPFMAFLIIVPIFVLIAIKPALVLLLLAMSYIISGPIFTLILLHRHRAARKDAR